MKKKIRNLLNIYKEMWKLSNKLELLRSINIYDVDMLMSALNHKLDQLNYFYGNLVQKNVNKDPNDTYYKLKPEPKEHQLIYIELGRGYPKELFDIHWGYVLKHCGTKLLIIPTTSIKPTSSKESQPYYYDIIESNGVISRLRLDEIRTIDKMRVNTIKQYRNVMTNRNDIEIAIKNFLSL